jgi:hypothetical protein
VPPAALTQKGIDESLVKSCEEVFFEERRRSIRAIFSPPHVLIREVIDGFIIPAAFSNQELVFSKQIVGVHASTQHEAELKALANRLNNSEIYGILAAVISGRMLVGRATSLLESDILSLPYPENPDEFDFNHWETALIEDIRDYLIDFRRRGEESSALSQAVDTDMELFGETYCRALNSIYDRFHYLKPFDFGSFICFPFCYGDEPIIELPAPNLVATFVEELLRRKFGTHLLVNRTLRIYEQNVVFMIKPNQKRYWLRSMALRDADQTLVDFLEQGF